MAEEQKKSASQSAIEAAGSLKQAAKLAADVGRVFAGDMSAIKDILTNKLFWEIIVVFTVIISMVGMVMGAAMTGVLQYLAASWQEHWAENRLDQAIGSNGNATAYKTTGWLMTLGDTINDVISDAFRSITAAGIAAGKGTSDNSQIKDSEVQAAGRNPNVNDYETTMQAIHQAGKLDQALSDRLEMIQGRVMQRGIQIKNAALQQYITGRNSEYNKIAKELSKKMEEKMAINANDIVVLYAGFNEALSEESFEFDLSAFDLSELQALKILAIFSVQHDCQLTEMDMWTLMDYCGWYTETAYGDLEDTADSIYDTVMMEQRYGNDIGSVTESNMAIPIATYEFQPLQVPVWTGTCAPQWYYEELAGIRDHNRQYLNYLESGNIPDGMIPLGINAPTLTSETYTIPGSKIPAGYKGTGPLGLPNEYYYVITVKNNTYATSNTIERPAAGQNLLIENLRPGCNYEFILTLFRSRIKNDGTLGDRIRVSYSSLGTYYVPPSITAEEADTQIDISQFQKLNEVQPYGIVDRLYYSAENHLSILRNDYSSATKWTRADIAALGDKDILKFWEKYIWAQEKSTSCGIVRRDDYGKHSFQYTDVIPSPSYSNYKYDEHGNILQYRYTTYEIDLYAGNSYVGTVRKSSYDKTFHNLTGKTTYKLYEYASYITYQYTYTYDEDGNIVEKTVSQTRGTRSYYVGSFTTFDNQLKTNAYQLYVDVDISFKARSVDEIAFDLLGIWPGSLQETVQVVRTTNNGNLVGKNSDGTFSYCLRGGNFTGLKTIDVSQSQFSDKRLEQILASDLSNCKLLRSRTVSKSEHLPLTTVQWTVQYGVNRNNELTNPEQIPSVGGRWYEVPADGGLLTFPIAESGTYYVHCRVTVTTQVLNADGSTSKSTKQYLLTIDYIAPNGRFFNSNYCQDTRVEDGALYAAGHLGNDKMLLNWTDTYTAANGTTRELEFSRDTGYQYETYVDMVMALSELLGIDYHDWDPAVQRAKEFGWTIKRK